MSHMIQDVIRKLKFNEDEEEDQVQVQPPFYQKKGKKRNLITPKEEDVEVLLEVPTKITRRTVQKYTIPNKAGSSARIATTTKKRKLEAVIVDADSRPFNYHLMVDLEFLRDHTLERVGELLENQGWNKLYLVNCTLNKDLARQFFSTLSSLHL